MRALKTILFHVLCSFRWLILGLLWILMFLLFLGFGLSWLLGPQTDAASLRWAMFALGVTFWAFSHFYDTWIFKLAPEDREVTLWR